MDKFGVPKKINRHVLKAIYTMHGAGYVHPNVEDICDVVEVTMRNNVPVRNLQGFVAQSLQNMSSCGVIEGSGSHYFVRNMDTTPSVSGRSSNNSELSKSSDHDLSNASVSSSPKESEYDFAFGAVYASSPRKRQRLSRGSQQGEDNPPEVKRQASGGKQAHSQTSVKSDAKSVNPKINILFKSKSSEPFSSPPTKSSEHGSKTNIKTEGSSSSAHKKESEQGEEVTASPSSRPLCKAEDHEK